MLTWGNWWKDKEIDIGLIKILFILMFLQKKSDTYEVMSRGKKEKPGTD